MSPGIFTSSHFSTSCRLTLDHASPGGPSIDSWVRKLGFSYTPKGLLDTVTSLNGSSAVVNRVQFKYSPWGQLAEDRQAHGPGDPALAPKVSYGYRNIANDIRATSMTYPSGRQMNLQYGLPNQTNDRLGRVESLRVEGEAVDTAGYQYCGLDRFVKVSYVQPGIDLSYIDPSGTNGGDAGDPYTGWDRFGRTQDMRWVKGATTLERVLYGYDRDSRRTWRENPVAASGEDEFYQYDGLSQVKDRTRGDLNVNHTAIGGVPLRKEAFGYDPIGNWKDYDVWQSGTQTLNQTRVHDTSNILTQIDGSSALLSHDAAGNMTEVPPQESGAWNSAYVLKWDAWNRLVKVSTPAGATVAEYAYDGLHRRTTKQAGGLLTHFYYNSQWRPVEERTGSGTEPAALYDWGLRYRDDLVRRIKWPQQGGSGSGSSSSGSGSGSSLGSSSGEVSSSGSGSAASSSGAPPLALLAGSSGAAETHYALHDYYNVTAIADITGAVVERYGYSAFGDVRFMTGTFGDRAESGCEWDLLYKAQFRDVETGYYNYGYRYYVPMLGRWINRDPIEEWGGFNLYAFVGNNSPNNNDRHGLSDDEEYLEAMAMFGGDPCDVYEAGHALGVDPEVMTEIAGGGKCETTSLSEFWNSFSTRFMGLTGPDATKALEEAAVETALILGPLDAITVICKCSKIVKTCRLTPGQLKRIKNAANRIRKDINLVGSRASGKTNPTSDWDYVVENITKREKDKIKNSLPGAKDNLGQDFNNLEFLPGPLDPKRPHIKIKPSKSQ